MKQLCNIFTVSLLLTLCSQLSFSQDTKNRKWSFETGLSAIDLYPVGEDTPQGEYFDEYGNLNDLWNIGVYLGVTRNFTENFSFSAKGSANELSKWGTLGGSDESILVDNLKYFSVDGMFNYSFGKGKFKPFLGFGGGYTWIEEGPFNTFSTAQGEKDLVGAGTANGSLGFKYWITDNFALKLQTTYKHSFKDYLPKHWDHNLGVVYRIEKYEEELEFIHTTAKETPWSFETGLSAIDLYPVGEDMPQGELFDEFFNLNDHYNLGVYLGVTRNITNNLTITAKGSANEISKWGSVGNADESILVDNLKYFALDGMINYNFGQGRVQPFIAAGGGYTWIEEGPLNTFSIAEGTDNLVGAGTANGSFGIKYWISDRVGVNLQTTYKHSFKEYLPKHWDHNLGLVYKIGEKVVVEEVSDDRDEDGVLNENDLCPDTYGLASLGGCPDSDGDGVADKDDLCPDKKGNVRFDGCPDSDGDGFPDSMDNCPNEMGPDNGCPLKVIEKKPEVVIDDEKVSFYNASKELNEEAKSALDQIANRLLNGGVDYEIYIEGHADSRGTDEYNYELSMGRAKAIQDYLVAKGIDNESITISGKGETQPIASNDTESGRALNRRVELTIKIKR